jgi:hypothetical protein
MDLLFEFVTEVCCEQCDDSSLVLEVNEHERKGCVSHLRARCESCGWPYIHFTLLRSKETLLMQIRGLFMPCEVLVKPYNSQTILCLDEHATSSPAYCLQGL